MGAPLGFKTFATGDVLTAADTNGYLMQGIWVFADATARDAAVTSPQEGNACYLKDTDAIMVYSGSAWVTKSGSTGLAPVAGKNAAINGAFQVWQRGTSVAFGANVYTADRWQGYNSSVVGTASRQPTSDTTNLPNIQYCSRVQRTASSSATTTIQYAQTLESINSIRFAGKTVTFSFYARKGANYSATSNLLNVLVVSGTGTDQNVLSGFTGSSSFINQNPTLTTTWQRFSYSATVGTTATQLGFMFNFSPTGTAGANDYFEVTGVQLEEASSVTDFATATNSIGSELALCQRYYWRNTNTANAYASYSMAVANTSTRVSSVLQFPVPMRIAPTTLEYANICFENYATSQYALSAVALSTSTNTTMSARLEGTVSGAVAGHAGYLNAQNSTSAYLAVSAEL